MRFPRGRAATIRRGAIIASVLVGCSPAAPEAEETSAALVEGCVPTANDGRPASGNHDALTQLLGKQQECPSDIRAFRSLLLSSGGSLETSFVDNRSFHAPNDGSFSFFESVNGTLAGVAVLPGELFFGHFTARGEGGSLELARDPDRGALMIELIAWDGSKGAFNFFEVIGDGTRGRWAYRGDSLDIMRDNAKLHRHADAAPPEFGRTLRCSGCHLGGGPIQKELATPHNDWWTTDRPLPLGSLAPNAEVAPLLAKLVDADVLAARVRAGSAKIFASTSLRQQSRARTLPEVLRPLFCPEEMNFESDPAADGATSAIEAPSAFFVDPRLATGKVRVSRSAYGRALVTFGSTLEGTSRRDADHAWLAPVKASADIAAVHALVIEGVVDDEFVSDVLAVDMSNPALSAGRCRLLRSLPESAAGDWRGAFATTLQGSTDPFAQELARNLTDPSRNATSHRARAAALIATCDAKLASGSDADVTPLVRLLAQRRVEVATNDISKNPRGQILEPGFRVIFPTFRTPPLPGATRLDDTCTVVAP